MSYYEWNEEMAKEQRKPRPQAFKPGNKAAAGADHSGRRFLTNQLKIALTETITLAEIKRLMGEVAKSKGDATIKVTKARALIDRLIQMGISGDAAAIREIFDRVEGKAKQAVEVSNVPVYDLKKLTDEELAAFERIARKAATLESDSGGAAPTTH